jgi:hypothetical protein
MYRVGLGDCFLLTFQPGTSEEAHVLVDVGSIATGDGIPVAEAVEDIAAVTGGRLRAVVVTHEHADHVSGFQALREAGVRADEAWFAWTEDGSDPLAKELRRHRDDLLAATTHAAVRLEAEQQQLRDALRQRDPASAGVADQRAAFGDAISAGIRHLLAFHGVEDPGEADALAAASPEGLRAEPLAAAAERARAAGSRLERNMDAARQVAGGEVRYWSPGDVVERDWATGVRFFVLGPPRDAAAIRRPGKHGSANLYELANVVGAPLPSRHGAPTDVEKDVSWEPFDRDYMLRFDSDAPAATRVAAAYAAEEWRQIDEATAGAAAELALQLDNCTNNTSLVLAIEIGGEVLLFVGDAQEGSWLTWPGVKFAVREEGGEQTVRGEELLRRTTFYKVGHHGSHNATTKPGLELMGERGLTAFIPLDEDRARRRSWPMPARRLLDRLVEKTHGRVLKSDRDARADVPGVTRTPRYLEITLPLSEQRLAPREPTRERARA